VINKYQVRGNVKEAVGRFEKNAGNWFGNEKLEMNGARREIEGRKLSQLGNLKEAIRGFCKS
jgi:uncharacterized protein YjbJ (UPF0337 family)